uniref:Hoar n=1 Tax=Helicoverpa armigera nucleopolyhedrovirus TaxID=51313 RepID=A0A482EU50_9ABAC|nr:hoar [Helicoverpa armigera nucleopolyhedrovirus]
MITNLYIVAANQTRIQFGTSTMPSNNKRRVISDSSSSSETAVSETAVSQLNNHKTLEISENISEQRIYVYLHLSQNKKRLGYVCKTTKRFRMSGVTAKCHHVYSNKLFDLYDHVSTMSVFSNYRKSLESFVTLLTKKAAMEKINYYAVQLTAYLNANLSDDNSIYSATQKFINKMRYMNNKEAIVQCLNMYKMCDSASVDDNGISLNLQNIRHQLFLLNEYCRPAFDNEHDRLKIEIQKTKTKHSDYLRQHKLDNVITKCSYCNIHSTDTLYPQCMHRMCTECLLRSIQINTCMTCKRSKTSDRNSDSDSEVYDEVVDVNNTNKNHDNNSTNDNVDDNNSNCNDATIYNEDTADLNTNTVNNDETTVDNDASVNDNDVNNVNTNVNNDNQNDNDKNSVDDDDDISNLSLPIVNITNLSRTVLDNHCDNASDNVFPSSNNNINMNEFALQPKQKLSKTSPEQLQASEVIVSQINEISQIENEVRNLLEKEISSTTVSPVAMSTEELDSIDKELAKSTNVDKNGKYFEHITVKTEKTSKDANTTDNNNDTEPFDIAIKQELFGDDFNTECENPDYINEYHEECVPKQEPVDMSDVECLNLPLSPARFVNDDSDDDVEIVQWADNMKPQIATFRMVRVPVLRTKEPPAKRQRTSRARKADNI